MPAMPALASRGARMLAAGVASGALAAVLLVAGARWGMPAALHGPVQDGGWPARSRAWFTADGFYAAEVDTEARRSFSWTRDVVRFVVPHLDRASPHRFELSLAPGRPGGVPVPALRVAVDGAVRATVEPSNDPRILSVEIPARAAPGAVIVLDVSNTFVPGA